MEPLDRTCEKIWPESCRDFVLRSPDVVLQVIVSATPGRMSQAQDLIVTSAELSNVGRPGTEVLNIIEGFAVKANGGVLLNLATSPFIDSIWYIHPKIFDVYVRIIKSLEDFLQSTPEPSVANISIGPPAALLPMPFRPAEPMNRATKIAADHQKILIFAAGNEGPEEDTLNPWGIAPWVISVGAATKEGDRLADFSSRGRPGDALYRPTIVAPGIDIITTHPPDLPKAPELLEAEERIGFKKLVPQDKWPLYTVVSGSSIAAPHVSRIAGQIIYFLTAIKKMAEEKQPPSGEQPSFAQLYTIGPNTQADDRVTNKRLVGSMKEFNTVRTASYPIEVSPTVVKQIILDMAIPMPGYQPHEVGAGFVTPALAEHYFGGFGIVDPGIISYKVM